MRILSLADSERSKGEYPRSDPNYLIWPEKSPKDQIYYVYGTPGNGAGQFGHPALLSVLFFVEREWQVIDHRKFGIGNINRAGGRTYPKHSSHKDGLQVDVRAVSRCWGYLQQREGRTPS